MIEKVVDWVLHNRGIVIIFYVFLLIAGLYVVNVIPIDAIPDVGENQQVLVITWEGKDPKTIEDQVTYPLVSKFFGIPGLKTIRSSSSYGFSMIYLIFEGNVEFYWSRSRIIEKLQQIIPILPEGVKVELGPDATGLGQVFWYYIHSDSMDLVELRTLQDWYIRYQLSSVKGVSEVASIGGFVKQYQISVDPNKLLIYNIGINDLMDAIKKSSYEIGAGEVEVSGREVLIRSDGFIRGKEDIEHNLVAYRNGVPIMIKDIATVDIVNEPRRGVLIDGKGREVVGGVVIIRYGENPREVISRVKEKINQLNALLPKGTKIIPYYDRTEIIEKVEHSLVKTLIEEGLIVIFVIFLFLSHLRSSFVISLSLPFSILIAFIVMYVFRIGGNIMSISGIAIAIGTLVDISIIAVENIYRNMSIRKSENVMSVILYSLKEVGPAITSSMLMIVVSFLPIFFLTGREGKLFHPLAYTKTLSIIGSLVVALTLCPVLASFLVKGKIKSYEESFLSRLIVRLYERVISFLFDKKIIVFVLSALLVFVSVILSFRIGREFMPQLDEGSILYMPSSTPAISITKAKEVMALQNRIISSVPEVREVVGKIGRMESATDPAPVEMFETIITLKDRSLWRKGITKEKIIQELNEKLKIPGFANIWTQPIINRIEMLSTGIRTQVGVKIFGSDIYKLQEIADKIKDILGGVRGVKDLYVEKLTGKPYIQIIPDRFKLSMYGISIEEFNKFVELAIGGMKISYSIEGRERYSIKIRFYREIIDSPEKIKRLFVPLPDGKQVPLSYLAEVKLVEMPSMINSENGLLRIIIFFNVEGRDVVSFVEEAKDKIDRNLKGQIPPGYFYEFDGEYKNQARASKTLLIVIPLSLLIILVIGYINFRSILSAILIFTSIPVSISGGIILLYVLGHNFSVATWTGFLSLFGIAANDAIVITTYIIDRLKDTKISSVSQLRSLIIDAGKARIRPAMMIMITVLLSLAVVILIPGVGKEVMVPMAIPMVGGMITLPIAWFIIPLVYETIYSRKLSQ